MAKPVLGKSVCSDWFFVGQESRVFLFWKKSRQTQNLQPKQRKTNKKTAKLSFFTAKLPEKAKKIEILPKFRTNILQASFIRLKIWKLLMQKLKQALPKARRP